jgi:LysR family transcriptional regulator, glycine cleavage system transcriptional activator
MNQAHPKLGALPLSALRAFEAAARLRSFRDGAAEVGLSPSAVSHHVRQLEATLGVVLFERLHRGVVPTLAGRDLATALGAGFATIAAAYAAARAPHGRLVVSAAPNFAGRWLLRAVAPLRAEGIELQIEDTASFADVEGGACDVAIRMAPRPPPRLAAERLVTSPVVLVAAPARLGGRDALSPSDIAAGPLLGLTVRPGFWQEALHALGASAEGRSEVRFDSFDAALQAAEAGHGFAFAPEIVVADRLASGTLALAHPRRLGRRTAWSYWFLTRPEAASRPAVRRLRDWLVEAFAADMAKGDGPAASVVPGRPTG